VSCCIAYSFYMQCMHYPVSATYCLIFYCWQFRKTSDKMSQ